MASPGRVLHLSENLSLPFDRRVWMELNAVNALAALVIFKVLMARPVEVTALMPTEVFRSIWLRLELSRPIWIRM